MENFNQSQTPTVPPQEPIQINSSKFSKPVIVSLIIVGTFIAGYFVLAKYQSFWPFNVPAIQPTPSPTTSTVENNDRAGWKTYNDNNLGISFNYPEEWGDVVVENGNEKSIEIPPCEGPLMKTYATGKEYPWSLYTNVISFSKASIDLQIYLVDLTKNIPKTVCSSEGDEISLLNVQSATEDVSSNRAGVKFTIDESLTTSINTNLSGPTYATRYNNKLVYIYSGYTPYAYTPEANELEEKYIAPCGTDVYNDEKGCGIVAWARTGTTAAKVREGFGTLKELAQSISLR